MTHTITTAYLKESELLFLPQEDGEVKIYVPFEVVVDILKNKDHISLDDPRYGARSKDRNVAQSS